MMVNIFSLHVQRKTIVDRIAACRLRIAVPEGILAVIRIGQGYVHMDAALLLKLHIGIIGPSDYLDPISQRYPHICVRDFPLIQISVLRGIAVRFDLDQLHIAAVPFEQAIGAGENIRNVPAAEPHGALVGIGNGQLVDHPFTLSDRGIGFQRFADVDIPHLGDDVLGMQQCLALPHDLIEDAVVTPVINTDLIHNHIHSGHHFQIYQDIIPDMKVIFFSRQLREIPFDLQCIHAGHRLHLNGCCNHGFSLGFSLTCFQIVLSHGHIVVEALLIQQIVVGSSYLPDSQSHTAQLGIQLHGYKQMLASEERIHHGQILIFAGAVVVEIQMIGHHFVMGNGSGVCDQFLASVHRFFDVSIPDNIFRHRCICQLGVISVKSDYILKIYLGCCGVFVLIIFTNISKGILCGGKYREFLFFSHIQKKRGFRIRSLKIPGNGVIGSVPYGIARALQSGRGTVRSVGGASLHRHLIQALFRQGNMQDMLCGSQIGISHSSPGLGPVHTGNALPFRKQRLDYYDFHTRTVQIEHGFHLFRRYKRIHIQKVLQFDGFASLAHIGNDTVIVQPDGIGKLLAHVGHTGRCLLQTQLGGAAVDRILAGGFLGHGIAVVVMQLRRHIVGNGVNIAFRQFVQIDPQGIGIDSEGQGAGAHIDLGIIVQLPAECQFAVLRIPVGFQIPDLRTGGGSADSNCPEAVGHEIVGSAVDHRKLYGTGFQSLRHLGIPGEALGQGDAVGKGRSLKMVTAQSIGVAIVAGELDGPHQITAGLAAAAAVADDVDTVAFARLGQGEIIGYRDPSGLNDSVLTGEHFRPGAFRHGLLSGQDRTPDLRTAAGGGGGGIDHGEGELDRGTGGLHIFQIDDIGVIGGIAGDILIVEGHGAAGLQTRYGIRPGGTYIDSVNMLLFRGAAHGNIVIDTVAGLHCVQAGALAGGLPFHGGAGIGDGDLHTCGALSLHMERFQARTVHSAGVVSKAVSVLQTGVVENIRRQGSIGKNLFHRIPGVQSVDTHQTGAVCHGQGCQIPDLLRRFKGQAGKLFRGAEGIGSHSSHRVNRAVFRLNRRGDHKFFGNIPGGIYHCGGTVFQTPVQHAVGIRMEGTGKGLQRFSGAGKSAAFRGEGIFSPEIDGTGSGSKTGEIRRQVIDTGTDNQVIGRRGIHGIFRGDPGILRMIGQDMHTGEITVVQRGHRCRDHKVPDLSTAGKGMGQDCFHPIGDLIDIGLSVGRICHQRLHVPGKQNTVCAGIIGIAFRNRICSKSVAGCAVDTDYRRGNVQYGRSAFIAAKGIKPNRFDALTEHEPLYISAGKGKFADHFDSSGDFDNFRAGAFGKGTCTDGFHTAPLNGGDIDGLKCPGAHGSHIFAKFQMYGSFKALGLFSPGCRAAGGVIRNGALTVNAQNIAT